MTAWPRPNPGTKTEDCPHVRLSRVIANSWLEAMRNALYKSTTTTYYPGRETDSVLITVTG